MIVEPETGNWRIQTKRPGRGVEVHGGGHDRRAFHNRSPTPSSHILPRLVEHLTDIADDGSCESSEFPANQSVGMEC